MPGRDRILKTEAIVLRRMDMGEADRLVILFSPIAGKLRAIAKGVRRPRSRKAGHLEPFTRVEIVLARGRELDIISQASAIDHFPEFGQDLERLGEAAYAVELLDRFTVEGGESGGLYRLLMETLQRLRRSDLPPSLVMCYYELRLLDITGFRPELFRCLGCSQEIQPQAQYLSAHEGGVLCPKCGRDRGGARPIGLPALKALRHYQRSAFQEALAHRLGSEVQAELEGHLEAYLSFVLERHLNSPHFLRAVRSLPGLDARA
jgi:DNA repair protein RecO (recombination protein O)